MQAHCDNQLEKQRLWRTTAKNDSCSLSKSKDYTACYEVTTFNCKVVAQERLTESTKKENNI